MSRPDANPAIAPEPDAPAPRAVAAPAGGRSAPDPGDACPGALRLHAADDGHLARLRLPGGLLTAPEAALVADLADGLGDGHLDLTSRGNLQLRGLPADAGAALAAALGGAGLLPSAVHERVRNVLASPLAGLDGLGHGDLRPWVAELDALLCGAPEFARLSGRFLFACDDGRGDVAALDADVTLVDLGGGEAGLRVPGAAELRLAHADAPRAATAVAAGFLAAVPRGARAWRVGELPADRALDTDRVRALLTAAGITVRDAAPEPPRPARPPLPRSPALGPVAGPDGLTALSLLVPLGRVATGTWRAVAELAARGGAGQVRVTPWRGLVLPGFTAAGAPQALAEAVGAGLVASADSPWAGVTACTGRPGCAKSLADVRADAAAVVAAPPPAAGPGREVAAARAAAAGGPLPVHWSGCERRCGHPRGAWVDVLAHAPGPAGGPGSYRVAVHGPDGSRPAPGGRP
ncbi:cobalamin biosynthesis protein CobG [Streptomyces sp. NPDC059740]|uniref:cobalamin biosynthesis protein CobG n=1 Tax=Streptomyces sp. NPDC059740 TaxID=3346926 RepID=UPI003667CC99